MCEVCNENYIEKCEHLGEKSCNTSAQSGVKQAYMMPVSTYMKHMTAYTKPISAYVKTANMLIWAYGSWVKTSERNFQISYAHIAIIAALLTSAVSLL